jgi:hypothetical protein
MRSHHFTSIVGVIAVTVLAGSACTEQILPNAVYPNFVDTLVLSAVTGTPVTSPSALVIGRPSPSVERTDISTAWDFVFDIDTLGRGLLTPSHALHLGASSGLLSTPLPFNDVRDAPSDGYVIDSASVVVPGAVFVARSRQIQCELGSLFFYAKLHVLTVDLIAREVRFEILGNVNCGYRSLQPGTPKQ